MHLVKFSTLYVDHFTDYLPTIQRCSEWWREMDNQATTPFSYCPSTAFLSVQPHHENARWNKRQEDLNSLLLGELDETTRTPWYYTDEDYPAGPEIQ